MILFHGTKEKNVKSIIAKGLFAPEKEKWERYSWWGSEIGPEPCVFLSNKPRAGVGSSPLEFAAFERGNGYIIVIDILKEELDKRLLGIWETHDIDLYYDLRFKLNEYVSEYSKKNAAANLEDVSETDVYQWLIETNPLTAERIHVVNGVMDVSPHWLLSKRKQTLSLDCQLVVTSIPPCFINKIIKVYDHKKRNLEPQFNPKMQKKLKHKQKSFASMFWNYLKSNA